MDLDLQQQVQKRLSELPQDVQAAVRSAEVAQKIQAIGKRHTLHVDQMGKLEDEVYLVMLGFADPAEFADALAGELGIAPAASTALATEVSNEIFMPIRASMQEWAEGQTAKEDATLVTKTLVDTKPTPAPVAAPMPTPAPAPTSSKPQIPSMPTSAPDLSAADAMLSGKKVTPPAVVPTPAASPEQTKPQQYKADPYREPVE